jgi:ubiquinone/menaquinone biosynthesis C-methylase UbiE
MSIMVDPGQTIRELQLDSGMRVADLGAGSGHYVFEAASIVGHTGRVFGIELQQDLAARVKRAATEEGLENVEVLRGDLETYRGSMLDDASVDRIILSNIFFQITNKETLAHEAYRILKPGGKALVIDWRSSFGGMGPPPEHVVSSEDVHRLVERAGFTLDQPITPGEYHFGFIYNHPKDGAL